MERPIAGSRLIPFESGATMRAGVQPTMVADDAITSEYDEANIYPNPISHDASHLTVTGLGSTHDQFEGTVQIQRMTGEIVYFETMNRGLSAHDYSIPVGDVLTP